jgi:chromosome segregation ATPase
MVAELNREIESQRSALQDQRSRMSHQMKETDDNPKTLSNRSAKVASTNENYLREQLAIKEEQRQQLIHSLADIRGEMVKIAEGNLKAINDEDEQRISVQALIVKQTAPLQEKIDDYEKQLQHLKRELKTQKTLVQQHHDEVIDAREKLGQWLQRFVDVRSSFMCSIDLF